MTLSDEYQKSAPLPPQQVRDKHQVMLNLFSQHQSNGSTASTSVPEHPNMNLRLSSLLLLIVYVQGINVFPKTVKKCMDDKKSKILFVPHLEMVNKTHISFTGNVTWLVNFDDKLQITLDVARKNVFGNWLGNIFSMKLKKACSDLKRLAPGVVEKWWDSTPGSTIKTCPFPKGRYYVEKFIPNISVQIPATPPGIYRVTATVYGGNTKIACIQIEILFQQ